MLPSRWYENGPLVILEAYAHATPVIGTNLGAIPEFVQEDKNGYLFAANDPVDLHRILEKSIRDLENMREMGLAGYRQVQTTYSSDKYVVRLEEILEKAMQQR